MENVFTKINNLYTKSGFIERYGTDIWMAIIICIVFFVTISYFYVMNNVKPILADWENQKCSPAVIPFVGLINKPIGESAFKFTGDNFTGCMQTILKTITADAFAPIYYLMKTFTDEFDSLVNSVSAIRNLFDKIRNSLKEFSQEVMGRLLNILMPILQFVINMKDMLGKIVGTLGASTYTLMGSYLALESLFANIINFIITILIALSGTIVGLLFIPFVGEALAAPLIAIMIAILVVFIPVQSFMSDVFKLQSRSAPKVPGCFSEHTLITKILNNNNETRDVKISDICIGDILADYSKVTGIIKFSAKDQHIYNLYNVIVTGEHRVFHDKLGWIKVKNHPASLAVKEFNEPFVYCLLTTTKHFKIGEVIYSDWDDIDEEVINALEENCPHLPTNFINEDIHYYLDNGMYGKTKLVMNDGITCINLENIKVNDILCNGVVVLGKIKIDAIEMNGVYKYKLTHNGIEEKDNIIICSKNIHLNSEYLGKINTFDISGEKVKDVSELYQLITNTGSFQIKNNIQINDYNYGIDKYILSKK